MAWSSFFGAQTTRGNSLEEKILQANALQDKGNLRGAREIYDSVLKVLPKDHPSLALGDALTGLSNLAELEGNYQQSVELARQAGDVYHQLGNAGGEAAALNSRAVSQGELGQYPAAQTSLRQALVLSKGVADFQAQVRTLNNLGNAYFFPGNYLEALRSYEEAREIVQTRAAEKWAEYWLQITKINQATLYQRLGRYQEALDIYKQIEVSQGLTPSDRAHLLTNLGALYRRLGDPWKALDRYHAALNLYSRQHDSDGEISVLKNIGIVHALDRGDLDQAQGFFQRSLSLANKAHSQREEMQAHLYLGETLLRKNDIKDGQHEFELALASARSLGTTEEEWKAQYGIGRSEELDGRSAEAETAYRAGISVIEATRTELQLSALRAEFLADKRDVYDALIRILLAKHDIKEAFSFLERSRSRIFQDRLAAGAVPKPATLEEIRSNLTPETILMEFWTAGDDIALIWSTNTSSGIERIQLSNAERESLLTFTRGLPDSLRDNWRSRVAIFSRLISNGSILQANIRHAIIVPDGWLASFPFDLIPSGDSARTLLIERLDISYLPTAALLRRPQVLESAVRFPWMQELVAFGNPVLHAQVTAHDTMAASGELQALPFSGEEIQGIAGMMHGGKSLFLGQADLKSAFLAGTGRAPILHVSTHAFADTDIPESSRILFSPERPGGALDYLFLREVYDMDLKGIDLATLSACNTARGKMIRGEGVQAFGRALLLAGSRSSLTTLWRVQDQPTSEFMKQFYYFAVDRKQSKAGALRSAKLKFLHSKTTLEDPANWAGFVLNGDGLGTLPQFVSWGELIAYPTMLVVLIAAVLWLLRSRRRVDRVDSPKHIIAQQAQH